MTRDPGACARLAKQQVIARTPNFGAVQPSSGTPAVSASASIRSTASGLTKSASRSAAALSGCGISSAPSAARAFRDDLHHRGLLVRGRLALAHEEYPFHRCNTRHTDPSGPRLHIRFNTPPAPHEYFASHEKLASWVTLCLGNYISACKRSHSSTGKAGTYIKPMLVQAAWSAVKTQGRLQARHHRLVRRFGGPKNPAAVKKAILGIANTLLKIAYQVLRSGKPYEDPGADFYTRRESPEQRRAYLLRQLEKLCPGCTITITPAEAA